MTYMIVKLLATILISSRLTNTTVLLIEATESDSLECPDGYSVPVGVHVKSQEFFYQVLI